MTSKLMQVVSGAPKKPETAPPLPALAASDVRLRDDPRIAPLRRYLEKNPLTDYRELARLLGFPLTGTEVGLVQFLTQSGLISSKELHAAKEKKRSDPELTLPQALRRTHVLGDTALAMAFAVVHRLPFFTFPPDSADPGAVGYLDATVASRWFAFPARFTEGILILAVADPKSIDIEAASAFLNHKIRLAVTPQDILRDAIEYWYGEGANRETASAMGDLDLRGITMPNDEKELYAGTDVVTIVNRLILQAAAMGASDVHILPDARFVWVHFRLDGKIFEQARLPLSLRNQLVSRIKVLSGMDIAEKRLPQDGNIRTRMPNRIMDIRVSDIPAVQGETLVLRLLDLQVGLVRLEELGFLPEDQKRLRRAVSLPYGMILLTGPTGSGKSTTLRAALDFIQQKEARHILTVEDPVEVTMERVTQVRVNEKIGFTFARALRQFLRHDPDVIMVGEIRDGETARIAVQAALTGHLVLTTLHTNDAPGAITRLLDMGVEPFLVSSAATLVIAQRLVRRLCLHCRQSAPPTDEEASLLRSMGYSTPVEKIFSTKGCPKCNETGFKGRTVIYEMLTMDEELKTLTARRESAQVLRTAARAKGFQSLVHSGLHKVLTGETALSEVVGYLDTLSSPV